MDKPWPFHFFFEKSYLRFLRRGQKLDVILEKKVVQNQKLEKEFLTKNPVKRWTLSETSVVMQETIHNSRQLIKGSPCRLIFCPDLKSPNFHHIRSADINQNSADLLRCNWMILVRTKLQTKFILLVKFIYSKKVRKFYKISTNYLTGTTQEK